MISASFYLMLTSNPCDKPLKPPPPLPSVQYPNEPPDVAETYGAQK